MKIARYEDEQGIQLGQVTGDEIKPLSFNGSMIELIANWADLKDQVLSQSGHGPIPLSKVRLLSPVERPGKAWAIGLNYADHIAESDMETPETQVWFSKATTSITGPYHPVHIPKVSQYVDYESELVAIIGKTGKNITKEDAPNYVFGYCVGNDVTERMWQHRTPQWSLGKSFDTHGPIGPWITTHDDISDPHALDLSCTVNGETRQNSNTRHLVFNIWEQIEHLSAAMTLEPGDVIFTGTPAGVGAAMDPRQFLAPGDVVRCEIEGLGHIENTFEAEA